METETTVPTPIAKKTIEATTPHVLGEMILSSSFLTSLKFAIGATSWEQVDAMNAHLDLLPDPGEFEDFVKEHKAEFKWKENKNTIKTYTMRPMNELINRVKKMEVEQKTHMDCTSTRITELETKFEQMKSKCEGKIDTKIK